MNNGHQWQLKKIKILGAVLELPATALPIQHIYQEYGQNGLNRQCCLAGSSNTAPRILIFLIAMGAKPSYYLKFIAT